MNFWSGFVFRKNSTWVSILNEGINRNLKFIYAVNDQYFKGNVSNCIKTNSHVRPLGFLTVLGCFTWLLTGFTVAFLYLIFEHFYKTRKDSKMTLNLLVCSTHSFFTRQKNRSFKLGDINFTSAQRFKFDEQWFFREKQINDNMLQY
jgi:hypothetical protein